MRRHSVYTFALANNSLQKNRTWTNVVHFAWSPCRQVLLRTQSVVTAKRLDKPDSRGAKELNRTLNSPVQLFKGLKKHHHFSSHGTLHWQWLSKSTLVRGVLHYDWKHWTRRTTPFCWVFTLRVCQTQSEAGVKGPDRVVLLDLGSLRSGFLSDCPSKQILFGFC